MKSQAQNFPKWLMHNISSKAWPVKKEGLRTSGQYSQRPMSKTSWVFLEASGHQNNGTNSVLQTSTFQKKDLPDIRKSGNKTLRPLSRSGEKMAILSI